MRAAIPYLIAVLLFVAWLRIADAGGSTDSLRMRFGFLKNPLLIVGVLIAQLVLPVILYIVLYQIGIPALWCMAAVLVAAAAPISGGPNLVLLMGGDGSLALRWLTVGTILMPLTSIPVLSLLLPGESHLAVFSSIVKLLLIILVAMLAAFVVQKKFTSLNKYQQELDGVAAILLALMVIGLMSAVHHPTSTFIVIVQMLLVAVVINVGMQLLGVVLARLLKRPSVAYGVLNGNRNIALFLAALPYSVTEPLLLFIACYQIPMYLTPLIGQSLYRGLDRLDL